MKLKLKIKTIEDIALQFIKRNEPIKRNIINTSKTLIDYKFCIKKYSSKNQENSLSQNYERLVPIENKENIPSNGDNINKMKVIKFYKIPQKDLNEEEDFSFHSELGNESISEIKSQRTYKIFSENDIKLRNIKRLKYNKNLGINLSYQNIYNSITEVYYPLMQNFESISSLKSMTNNTLSCIEFFSNHDSIFELIPSGTDGGGDVLSNFFDQLKIYENIEISLILFIMHIILETKIEYLDSFNEDDILVIYHDCFSVIQKFYEMIILIILLKDNLNNETKSNETNDNKNNKDSISFESLCLKYVKDFFKFSQKPKSNEDIVNKINDNISLINKLLLNSCAILFGNLILFKKDSGNLEHPDKIETFFLDKYNNENAGNNFFNRKEKIFLSKEFLDQYIVYKTMYIFFMKEEEKDKEKDKENDNLASNINNDNNNNSNNNNNTKKKEENNSSSEVIFNKLTTMNSSFKEISYLFILYYTNFKILLERNKVKAPFLPPLDTEKYKYSLILDLDETLVHYIEEENRAYVQVRPYADFF